MSAVSLSVVSLRVGSDSRVSCDFLEISRKDFRPIVGIS